MTDTSYSGRPDTRLYLEYRNDPGTVTNTVSEGARVLRYALFENGKLTEYSDITKTEPAAGSIYAGRTGDFIKNTSSAFVILKEQSKGTLRGYLPSDRYRPGDAVLVQVKAPETSNKLCRLTDSPAISGQYTVLLLNAASDKVNVSAKLSDLSVRDHLKQLGNELLNQLNASCTMPVPGGIIMRTAAASAPDADIIADWKKLCDIARNVISGYLAASQNGTPGLLYQEDRTQALISKYVADPACTIYVNSALIRNEIISGLKIDPACEFVSDSEALFDKYGIDREYAKISGRTVNLPSGGNIVIDRTEALTVFDVNTASSVRASSRRELILNTNLEAVEEIARQLRLRSINGMVVCDFINMDHEPDGQLVIDRMREITRYDPAPVTVHGFTRLKLLELVRSRTVHA